MANDGVHSKLHCWACTGPMYGCMGLGALAKLTQKPQHIALLRNDAEWMPVSNTHLNLPTKA